MSNSKEDELHATINNLAAELIEKRDNYFRISNQYDRGHHDDHQRVQEANSDFSRANQKLLNARKDLENFMRAAVGHK